MKTTLLLLAGVILAGPLAFLSEAQAQTPANHNDLGDQKQLERLVDIEVKNFQDESLGRVRDLGIDLVNGKIVEVLVGTGGFLGIGSKITAVPPKALLADPTAGCYRLNASPELFASAPAVDLSTWNDATHGKRIAAAYRLFGQVPYFQEEGVAPGTTPAGHPKVALSYVERSSKILDLIVRNRQNVSMGFVSSLTIDIPNGRIRSVIINHGGEESLDALSVVPAMALSFNDKRDALVLDDSKSKFEAEPRYVLTSEDAFGYPATAKEEDYVGPRMGGVPAQGSSYRDVDRTVLIYQNIRTAKINVRNIEVGTLNGRVIVSGWVATEDEKRRVGQIALAASQEEGVDNQLTVGEPARLAKPLTQN